MTEAPGDLLTATQAAEYLGMTRQGILRLTKDPPNLGKRYGFVWLFTKAELNAWRDRPRTQGGRPPGSKNRSRGATTADK